MVVLVAMVGAMVVLVHTYHTMVEISDTTSTTWDMAVVATPPILHPPGLLQQEDSLSHPQDWQRELYDREQCSGDLLERSL